MNYYAHTISKFDNYMLSDFEILENILKSGYLLSRRNLGLSEKDALFNGMDYLSLTDLEKSDGNHSSFEMYTKKGLSLLFSKNINVIIPKHIHLNSRDINIGKQMHTFGKKGRFSDLCDEVQVKDKLSLEYLQGLCLSMERIQLFHSNNYINYYLYTIYYMLNEYGYKASIINLDTELEMDTDKVKKYIKNV